MTTLYVKNIINSNDADSYQKADLLYNAILNNIENNELSFLDFTDIDSITASFFNRSVSSFYFKYEPKLLNELIKIKPNSLEAYQMLKLQRSLKNAKAKAEAIKNDKS